MMIQEESRLLFMKYALPCAGTLVKRGKLAQQDIDELINIIKTGSAVPEGAENIFKVAMAACSLLAMDKGMKLIDDEVIREYFLFGHDDVIDRRYEEMGDFDPEACRTRAGVVEDVLEGAAIVRTSAGAKEYRTDFADVREGDLVVVHWNFIVERIDKQAADKMDRRKVLYS